MYIYVTVVYIGESTTAWYLLKILEFELLLCLHSVHCICLILKRGSELKRVEPEARVCMGVLLRGKGLHGSSVERQGFAWEFCQLSCPGQDERKLVEITQHYQCIYSNT